MKRRRQSFLGGRSRSFKVMIWKMVVSRNRWLICNNLTASNKPKEPCFSLVWLVPMTANRSTKLKTTKKSPVLNSQSCKLLPARKVSTLASTHSASWTIRGMSYTSTIFRAKTRRCRRRTRARTRQQRTSKQKATYVDRKISPSTNCPRPFVRKLLSIMIPSYVKSKKSTSAPRRSQRRIEYDTRPSERS